VTGVKGSNSRCFWIIWTKTWNCQCAGKKLFNPYVHENPFATEAYKALPPLKSRLNWQDNGDGTITAPDASLMWVQAESHAVLKKCFNWRNAQVYVKNLTTYFVTGMGFIWRL